MAYIKARTVELDESADWLWDDSEAPYVKGATQRYIYNANEVTYCAEFTPSYWLVPVGHADIEIADGCPEDVAERIKDAAVENYSDEIYVHTYRIDALPSQPFHSRRVRKDDAEDVWQEIVQAAWENF
jgi:hypothetical protein